MRGLFLSKAKQEHFVFIIYQSDASSLPIVRKISRVSARDGFFNSLYWIIGILLYGTMHLKAYGFWTFLFNNFKLLRVLNYDGISSTDRGCKLQSNIGNLIHLRFLSSCMQTLDLRLDDVNIFEYIHVPNVICKMEQLRHLYLPEECNPKTKWKLGTLRNLQTLVNFNTKNCYVKDFMNMTNLRELEIRWPFNIEGFNTEELDKNPPIIQSEYLHSLSIINNIINDERRIDPKHLAHLLLSCKNISKLSLDEDPMSTLEKLPYLRMLDLHEKAFIRKEMFCSAQGFPKLESLSLIELNNLEEWKVGEGAMPSLQRLEIQSCIQLKKLPDGLRFIATLQEVKIGSMRKTFKDKVEEEEEDFCKVRHGLSIIFHDCEW
ncbi:hypothetical protein ES288_D11G346300v1 [Gossypium darwinii]|uniref:Disease resistance R13L4/SHOC-2-like LRR domain-containing protein n=1 Tax=Gossypium darwinii TaxID=34276 RepID=A0A5D2AST1_GOSDA|nr:hypothetical protein ES288_D11G346300v1 [Gossypium darwinii]